jgi:hypothetical protein
MAALPPNLDVHVFQLRDGNWAVRVQGLKSGRIILKDVKGQKITSAAEALLVASGFVSGHENALETVDKCWS